MREEEYLFGGSDFVKYNDSSKDVIRAETEGEMEERERGARVVV
jgi:hypothetical protein